VIDKPFRSGKWVNPLLGTTWEKRLDKFVFSKRPQREKLAFTITWTIMTRTPVLDWRFAKLFSLLKRLLNLFSSGHLFQVCCVELACFYPGLVAFNDTRLPKPRIPAIPQRQTRQMGVTKLSGCHPIVGDG